MPPTKPRESKQGLIITLVFFILATVILGVATYFGFSEQEKYDKAAKEAAEKLKVVEKDRDWYRFQSSYYLAVMGHSTGDKDLPTRKNQFDQGSLTGTDKDAVNKLIKDDLDKRFRWNAKEQKPETTYEEEINKQKAANEAFEKRNQELDKKLKETQKSLAKKDEELQEAQKDYSDKLAALTKTYKDEFDKYLQDLAKVRGEMDALAEARKKDQTASEEEKKTLTARGKKLEEDIKHLNKRIRDQEDRLAAFQVKSTEAPANMRSDWKIVRMDRRGGNPYINLGSADKVKPQLTFTIHGVGTDGRPNPQPKGTLEVVNVINEHLSQARITSVKDRNRDPILEGDVIYNPSWNPTIKKHVAVAGLIDLTGDGRDSLFEFMRNLERQNVVVDAYEDPKDGSIKGKITFRTDYLILGDVPDPGGRGKLGEAEKRVLEGRNQIENEAKKYGVPPIGLQRYLEMIGYRLPRGTREEPMTLQKLYNPDLRPEQAPRLGGDTPPPATPPDR